MADVFGTEAELGGVFKGNKFALVISGSSDDGSIDFEGALVQNIQLSYQRQITRFWALGSSKQYYIEGRTEGQGTLGRVVGPQGLIDRLVEVLADLCGISDRAATLTARDGSDCPAYANGVNATSLSIKLGGIISTGISFGADANQFVINSALNVMFSSLSKVDGQAAQI